MLEELIKKIADSAKLDESDIRERIYDKQGELSGLISEEGAAYIVAKELGVNLLRKQERLNLANVAAGMQNVDVVGKAIRVFPVREFATEKSKGRVQNVIIADSTGSVRLSLWNDEIDNNAVKEGDALHVRGFVRQDNVGEPEIRIGRYGTMQKIDEHIDVKIERRVDRSNIADLQEGQYREVRAALLQVFESNPFYSVCKECAASIKEKCDLHPDAEADVELVVSGIVDDGTESIRAVLFRENAEKILGMSKNDAKNIFDKKKTLQAVFANVELGNEYVFDGKVRKNDFFQRLEFIVNNVKNVDVKEETSMLING